MSEIKVTAERITSCKVNLGSINVPLEEVIDVIDNLLGGYRFVTIRCTWDECKIADGLSELGLVSKDWNGQSHVYRAGEWYNDKLKKFRDKLVKTRDTLTDPPDLASSITFNWNTKA